MWINAVSIASWEYDEVTDISEEHQSFSQATDYEYKLGDAEPIAPSSQLTSDHRKTLSSNLTEELVVDSEKIAGTISALDQAAMETVDENDFDPELEEKGLSDLGPMGGPGQPLPLAHPSGPPGGDDDDIDDDDDEDGQAPAPEGAYDPADYEHLSVSPEIEELFSYITRYTPQAIELEHRLRPYIPDYIPAVGDIDAFIKVPPPDNRPSLVGLEVLDEPSAKQSDPTVLDLQLRALAKHTTAKSVPIKTVENAEKNTKVIEKWVRDISDLHRAKPPPTVHYSKRMPDIDNLMQEWPGEVEELLKEISLPTAALDLELPAYVDIICATLDIPVYKSRIQSLHVLFTLFSVFKNSAHFRQLAEDNFIENDDSTADRVVFQ